jgi:hypothetical protein
MRKKLKQEDKKVALNLTINPIIAKKINELHPNKSKYIEHIIYQDLRNNNQINEILFL